MTKLTQGDIDSWEKAKTTAAELEAVIIDRIDYIVRTIYKTFGRKFDGWYFEDAQEGQIGTCVIDSWDGIFTSVVSRPYIEAYVMLKPEGEFRLIDDGIPIRWLYEDFEDELEEATAAHRQHLIDQKAKKAAKKIKAAETKKAKLAGIKAKLTPEELKLLKLK